MPGDIQREIRMSEMTGLRETDFLGVTGLRVRTEMTDLRLTEHPEETGTRTGIEMTDPRVTEDPARMDIIVPRAIREEAREDPDRAAGLRETEDPVRVDKAVITDVRPEAQHLHRQPAEEAVRTAEPIRILRVTAETKTLRIKRILRA